MNSVMDKHKINGNNRLCSNWGIRGLYQWYVYRINAFSSQRLKCKEGPCQRLILMGGLGSNWALKEL